MRAELTNARNILSNIPNNSKEKIEESLLIDCSEINKESLLQNKITSLTEEKDKYQADIH
jgi:hypothetical protein